MPNQLLASKFFTMAQTNNFPFEKFNDANDMSIRCDMSYVKDMNFQKNSK
jgi:hypothetical protein